MVEEWIMNWFEKNGSVQREKCILNENYLEQGYIDSFGFIALIGECEENFSISFSDDDFSNERMFTIQGLIECIQNRIETM